MTRRTRRNGPVHSEQVDKITVSSTTPQFPTEGELWIPDSTWLLTHTHPDRAPAVSTKPRPGSWCYPYQTSVTTTDNIGASSGALFQRPNIGLFYWGAATAFDAFACEVTTAGTGVMRWGLYPHDFETGLPGTLAFDLGTTDNTTAGAITLPVSFSLTRGWWWLLWTWQGSNTTGPVIRARSADQPVLQTSGSSTLALSSRHTSAYPSISTFTGALPASLGTNGLYGNGCLFPAVGFRTVA